MSIKNRFIRFLKGFKYAFRGLIACVKSERNMRIHLSVAFYVICFMNFYDLAKYEKAIIFLTIGAVIGFEAINTSIETCVDLVSPRYHPLAKKAKDTASGAVLCIAFFAAIIGFIFFFDIEVFKNIYAYFTKHVMIFIGFLISIVAWIMFIFSANATKEVKFKDDKYKKNKE